MLKAMVVGVSVSDTGEAKPRFVLDPKTLVLDRQTHSG
jgi:hypothetical protein